MAIHKGTNKIKDIYYGTNKIGKGYYGTNLVYDDDATEDFLTCAWSEVISYCNQLEAGTITTTQFCAHFLNGTAAITSMDGFVGLLREISINNVTHHVKVIGTQHDTISGGTTTAALTFQLEELLSLETGGAITTQNWNASSSSPYYNIWNDGTQSCDIRNYLRGTFLGYLPSEVQTAIKTVKKKTSAGNTSTTINELDETIFLLSVHEMASATGISGSSSSTISSGATTYNQEGNQYKYYADNLGDSDPYGWDSSPYSTYTIKKDLSSSAYRWWLRSPNVDYTDIAFSVSRTGRVGNDSVNNANGVAPAFCI